MDGWVGNVLMRVVDEVTFVDRVKGVDRICVLLRVVAKMCC